MIESKKVKELTILSISLGVVIGIIMTAANVYLGLYAGMTVSASIPAAVISMGVFSILKKKSVHQSNIVQTMASAGESLAAGVIFTLPALILVGAWKDFDFWSTTLIAVAGGLLGVIFMIPLRKALIVEDKNLVYPEGVACAAVLQAGSSENESSSKGFITIIKGLFVGGAFKFLTKGFGLFTGEVAVAKKIAGSAFFFGSDISPALLSVGYIVKIEVAILVFIGGAIGWFFAIPSLGTPAEMMDLSALDLSWTLWSKQIRYLGVGAMITGGLWSIVSVRSGIVSGIQGLKQAYKEGPSEDRTQKDMPLIGMLAIFALCFFIMLFLYNNLIESLGLSLLTTIVMIVASFLFVAVSSYIVGLVGSSNNPVSGMTISALLGTAALFLVLGLKGDSAILSTLGVAAVVCCAACTAGDCSQDLKTGSLIGATPRSQQIAQVIGVVIPAFVIAPVLSLLHKAEVIGVGLKAPQATLFASITQALFGKGTLPYTMVVIGMIAGAIIIFVDATFLKDKKFRLHLMPIAVGVYLPVTLAVPILIGGIIRYFIEKNLNSNYLESEDQGVLVSSGFIAGEAIMGVVVAILAYQQIDLNLNWYGAGMQEVVSTIAFMLVSIYLYRIAKTSVK